MSVVDEVRAHVEAAEAMYKALHVITDDPRISGWLLRHDPMALTQARNALAQYAAESETVKSLAVADEYDHCEDDGSEWCLLHDSRIVSVSKEPPYDMCGERQRILAKRARLSVLERAFEVSGGRGIGLADEIDDLRVELGLDERQDTSP